MKLHDLVNSELPKSARALHQELIVLYDELAEIQIGARAFGGFSTTERLDKKYRFDRSKYPKLGWSFSHDHILQIRDLAMMSPSDLAAAARSPLERLAVATLWKNGDLAKVRHIAAGIAERHSAGLAEHTDVAAPVFRQFGRHLANPDTEPIADQHTLRAYRYLLRADLTSPAHRAATLDGGEVREYVQWVRRLKERAPESVSDDAYAFDISMFELGKATRGFIELQFKNTA
jgi:hypothetical protein